MTNSQRLATVRSYLLRWLAEQQPAPKVELKAQENDAAQEHDIQAGSAAELAPEGEGESTNGISAESILIRDGFYCGRRFEMTDYRAVWFLEPDEIKIFAKSGELLAVARGDQLGEDSATADEAAENPQLLPLQAARDRVKSEEAETSDGDSAGTIEQEVRRAA